ncbi:hypothetical protein HMN09_00852700 [Mycena chlorophos]|uniref:Uncharacterized protein n=1 Tax=Mycena chlorophos TaxID=658473 RepID=A0A8H6W6B7_MYCCL|nr:hypothetical protein HMN09_00852700 [Mycena chlorophos]
MLTTGCASFDHLATYVKGMGLEDLEGSCRYASRFHRQQQIVNYIKHHDVFDAYAGLSKFICNKYRLALKILKTEDNVRERMEVYGVPDDHTFEAWLAEERAYLTEKRRSKVKDEETLEMDYVQKLIKYRETSKNVKSLRSAARSSRSDAAAYRPRASGTDVALRVATEKMKREDDVLLDLESRLEIEERWTPSHPLWEPTLKQFQELSFRKAGDRVEFVMVQHFMELQKTHQSGTSYDHRKHIAKSIAVRSKSAHVAVDAYNTLAAQQVPPKPLINWNDISKQNFLSDFTLLRESDSQILERPWARPVNRQLMDDYFRLVRAKEEIQRLDIEIKRTVTFIRDEGTFLRSKEGELRRPEGKTEEQMEEDLCMAEQVKHYRLLRRPI